MLDLNRSADELIGQIKGEPGTLTDYAAQATRGVLGFATDALLGVGELVYEGGKLTVDAAQTLSIAGLQGQALDAQILMEEIRLGNITSDTVLSDATNMASAMGQSIVAPVTEPWNNGQYIEAITRGGAEIASLPLAVLKGNKLNKAAKAADAASDASSTSRAAGTAQDAGNAVKSAPVEKAPDMAGSTAKATETAKIADTTSDTTKNADATGDAAKASDATKASEPKGPSKGGSGGKVAPNKLDEIFRKIPESDYHAIKGRSVHNVDSDTLVLGKYRPTITNGVEDWSIPGPDSYVAIARTEKATYFDLGSEWGSVTSKYKLSDDEMFKAFNIPVLDVAASSGKHIKFTHDPRTNGGFLQQEWEYLQNTHGYKRLKEIDGVWYAK